MKDLRPQRDPRELGELRQGASVPPGARSADEAQRTRVRHRRTAGLLIAGVLALVIAPHLIDSTRISSVAERAAEQAGGGVELSVGCPASGGYADAVNPPPPVTLERAVVCHYFAGSVDVPPTEGDVPPEQLVLLNADLQQHSEHLVHAPTDAALVEPGRRDEAWVVFGVTELGQRVTLSGQRFPDRFVWAGVGPDRVWLPSPSVQDLLTADLPS